MLFNIESTANTINMRFTPILIFSFELNFRSQYSKTLKIQKIIHTFKNKNVLRSEAYIVGENPIITLVVTPTKNITATSIPLAISSKRFNNTTNMHINNITYIIKGIYILKSK